MFLPLETNEPTKTKLNMRKQPLSCIVTAGPTYEPLDQVRRLTNSSTGRLGVELANFLVERGHTVRLLLSELAVWRGATVAQTVETFGTAESLREALRRQALSPVHAVFHAAAVADFAFGQIWERLPNGELKEIKAGKIPTTTGALFTQLVPTPKIIGELRRWFPRAVLVGWKYEVDGTPAEALAKASDQMRDYDTDACVANGPAYGPGFGLVSRADQRLHFANRRALYAGLEELLQR